MTLPQHFKVVLPIQIKVTTTPTRIDTIGQHIAKM